MARAVTNHLRHSRAFQPLFRLGTSIKPHTRTPGTPQPELRLPQSIQPCWHHQVPPSHILSLPYKTPRKANASNSQHPREQLHLNSTPQTHPQQQGSPHSLFPVRANEPQQGAQPPSSDTLQGVVLVFQGSKVQRAPAGGRHRATPGARIWLGAPGLLPGAGGCCWAARRWSTGVIMYTLLAGSPPFWHRKQMLMLRMIMNGDYQFGSPEWDDRSDTVKDLVRRSGMGKAFLGKSLQTTGTPRVDPVPSCRSPGFWWWTRGSDTRPARHWPTPSSSSMTWRRSGTSAPSGNSR